MMSQPASRATFRFLEFELDIGAYELRRDGERVRLERRPMDLLILMVERRGQLVPRSEIVARLWGEGVFIEVETAVNTLVRKIRQALGDSVETPKFIETVPGKGYRFIASVEAVHRAASVHADSGPADRGVTTSPVLATTRTRSRRGLVLVGIAIIAAAALAGWQWARAQSDRVRLAVLPFEAINVADGQKYLADALHEETIAALGQIAPERIEVIARTTMLEYRRTPRSLEQLAKDLDVSYIVESSVHSEGGRIRVTPKLIRARDQTQIWSHSYDDEPRSVLQFQRDLSLQMAEQIRVRLSPERLDALARRHSGNAEAFQLYLQGLQLWNQLTPQTTRRAIEYYTRATEQDPGYALPWAGMALAYAGAPINADADPRAMWPAARRAAERAIAADSRLAEAQTAIGSIHLWFDWDWAKAERMFRNAVAADPNYAFGRRMLGIALSLKARPDEAREHMRQLLRLEPTYNMNWALSAQVAFNARDFPVAVEFAKQASGFWIADFQLAMAYQQLGQHEAALHTIDNAIAGGATNSKLHALRGYVLARTGRADQARDVLRTLDNQAPSQYVPPYARALVHAALGDGDAAFEWLQRAHDERDVHLTTVPTDPKWDGLRPDARFAALLERCGFNRSAS